MAERIRGVLPMYVVLPGLHAVEHAVECDSVSSCRRQYILPRG